MGEILPPRSELIGMLRLSAYLPPLLSANGSTVSFACMEASVVAVALICFSVSGCFLRFPQKLQRVTKVATSTNLLGT